jgi:type I restriction enzyme M protein
LPADLGELESRLWDVADELRANSGLKASEYGTPVLGLIFLRFADARFEAARAKIEAKGSARRKIAPSDYHAERLIYLAPGARFSTLLELPEGSDLGSAVNEAMRLVEEHNPELAGVLPRNYTALDNSTIASLLRHISSYTRDLEGDWRGADEDVGFELSSDDGWQTKYFDDPEAVAERLFWFAAD